MELSITGFPPHATNGTCYLCNSSPEGPVVVTDKYDEWDHGTVCICTPCAKYIGKLMGLVEGKKLVTENRNLRERVEDLLPQARAYQEMRKALEGVSFVPAV